MIENGKLVVIDFDRYDFGDPWEELCDDLFRQGEQHELLGTDHQAEE